MTPTAKRPSETFTEMVQVVLPNDANPLGFILGGTVMHLIDIAGAIACHRHTRSLLVTAAVDGLQFLHPIKVGDLIILRSCVTAAWSTSLEVEVEVFSEETLTGLRRMTSRAYLTFVATDRDGTRMRIPGLILETEEERQRAAEAEMRRAQRLEARRLLEERLARAGRDTWMCSVLGAGCYVLSACASASARCFGARCLLL
jgi:acyl-CoA hydrolase